MSDPLGKRALFSVTETPRAANSRPGTATMQKESLFSASQGGRRVGTLVVECSTCGPASPPELGRICLAAPAGVALVPCGCATPSTCPVRPASVAHGSASPGSASRRYGAAPPRRSLRRRGRRR